MSESKNGTINTDFWGGLASLAIAAFFALQINEDFTPFGIYFPQHVLPLLVVCGVVLLVKAWFRPSRRPNFLHGINANMLTAILVGLFWIACFEFLGFLLSSFLSIMVLLVKYREPGQRSAGFVLRTALGTLAGLGVIWLIFVKLLTVTLPAGKIVDLLF